MNTGCSGRVAGPTSKTPSLPRRPVARRLLAAALLALCGASGAQTLRAEASPKAAPPAVSGQMARTLAEFNRAAALMEQYRYSEAAKAFEAVVKLAPDWTAARYNLGLASFNLHGKAPTAKDGKTVGNTYLNTARDAFLAVLASDSDHVPARFTLGLYHQYVGDNEKALECFQAAYGHDGEDPHLAYKYAEALIGLGRREEGTAMFEKAVQLDPGSVSAIYRLAMQYMRNRQREKALPLFQRFKELKETELTGGTFGVDRTIYGTVGKYYMVLGADNLPLPPAEPLRSRRIIFSPETKPLDASTRAWKWDGGSVDLPGMAVGDVDGDGDLDLCLTAVGDLAGDSVGAGGRTMLWLNDGSGEFSAGEVLTERGVSPCFGDVDNDGDLDLWLGRAGYDVLLQNDGKGRFYWNLPIGLLSSVQGAAEDGGPGLSKAAAATLAGADAFTSCARLVDLDSDGDLDFLAFRMAGGSIPAAGDQQPAANSLYNNNRDGTFVDLADRLGLTLADTPVAAAVYDDFDNDRDLDLVLFPAGRRSPIAWVNDRVWKYRFLEAAATGLTAQRTLSATSGDPDKDGDRDLLVFTEEGVRLYINTGRFRFEAHQGFADRCGRLGGTGGQFADMDNDGDLDIVIADAHRRDGSRGPVLLINDWPRDRFLNVLEVDPGNLFAAIRTEGNASCVVADFTGNGKCDVLLAPIGRQPLLIENVTPGGHWIQLTCRGTRTRDDKTRSNHSAIGARVEVKTGSVFQQFTVGVPSGPVAMPPLRIHAGLGANPKVDWLRILWPDAVLQAELEIAADKRVTVTELQRKISSCPYLFAWDGSRFEFVADFGGVGGLGYLVAPGGQKKATVYAPPDPTEYLAIPTLKPRDGEYVLKALTPLEEVTYFDEAKLIAVDHPLGTQVYPNEMMAINASPPAFEVFCFRRPIDPVRAVDHRGEDVTEEIRRVDRRYAGATAPDHRFIGLAEDHFVELDFGDRLQKVAADSRLILFLYGWVEYGYSSTNFAASQAGLRTRAPTIEVLRNGRWVELFRELGYPAGVQHMMTLEVTGKLLPGDRRIRISSNMELYWDRIFLAVHLGEEAVSLREVAVRSADLHFRGYPREYSPDGRQPNLYDYDNVDTAVAWKLMEGDYTRYGEVAELLERPDDCFVIMAHGDELSLRFPADVLGPVPTGRRRSFFLKTDSYCKDMDLYTAYPDTVEPLPFHAMSGYPYGPNEHYPDNERTNEYRRRYNTRRVRAR